MKLIEESEKINMMSKTVIGRLISILFDSRFIFSPSYFYKIWLALV